MDKRIFTKEINAKTQFIVGDEDLLENEKIRQFLNDKQLIYLEPTALNFTGHKNNEYKYSNETYNNYFKIPYTDHSSFKELNEFVKQLKPKRLELIVRKMLPNNVDTNNVACLEKYLNKSSVPPACREVYNLLLKSSSSIKKSSCLNAFQLNNKPIGLINRRFGKKSTSCSALDQMAAMSPRSNPIANRKKLLRKCTQINYETPEKKARNDSTSYQLNDDDLAEITKKSKSMKFNNNNNLKNVSNSEIKSENTKKTIVILPKSNKTTSLGKKMSKVQIQKLRSCQPNLETINEQSDRLKTSQSSISIDSLNNENKKSQVILICLNYGFFSW